MKAILRLVLLLACLPLHAAPNIVFIFSDDAGFRDFGFQGSPEFKTPNLDRLAREGVVCSNGYVSGAVCVPSRAGLLTGRYQQRFGVYHNDFSFEVPRDHPTMLEAIKSQGYETSAFGKWHVGMSPGNHPNKRGADYFFGFLGGHRFYTPWPRGHKKGDNPAFLLRENERVVDESSLDFYTTDLFTDRALEFIERSRGSEKPFFVYLAHHAVHDPLQALDADAKPYRKLEDPKRRTLGGMTAALDRSVGRLLDYLDSNDLRENTLVVFSNDNGGATKIHADNGPLRGHKGVLYEGGVRVPFVLSWPGTLPQGETFSHPVITLDLYPTFVKLAGGDPTKHPKLLDGIDLMPFLTGAEADAPHQSLCWEDRTAAAVRAGDWKLLDWKSGDKPDELYRLSTDIGEQTSLAAEQPEIVKRLKAHLAEWRSANAPDRAWKESM
ncbi:MAG: Arylsulfatase precursor [Planctomycetota bacterium]